MSDAGGGTNARCSCSVKASPKEVRAGGEVTLTAAMTCEPVRDLRGQTVRFVDADGHEVGRADMVSFDGETTESHPVTIAAPESPGMTTWWAVVDPVTAGGGPHEGASAEVPIEVRAQETHVVVWDVPTAVPAGSTFGAKIGLRCPTGQPLGHVPVEVVDENGRRLASAETGSEPWPGTSALYVADVELVAPDREGRVSWEVHAPGSDEDVPREPGRRSFRVSTVSQPDARVTVEAVDEETDAPIERIHVEIHPFRGYTDENGRVTFEVPQGAYRVHVSGRRYHPYDAPVEVQEDVTVRAELAYEHPEENVGM